MQNRNNKEPHSKSSVVQENDRLWLLVNTAIELQVYQNQERLDFLKTTMPSTLVNSFNSRDMNKLKLIMADAFLPNCQLRTSAMPNEVTGRHKVSQFFESYIQGCPDVSMEYVTPMTFNVRVISFICYEKGTRSNFNLPDKLFDHFLHDKMTKSPSYLHEKSKYNYLRNSGKPIPFVMTSYVNFILNEDMTHVEKYIHTCKEVIVDPQNINVE